MKVLVCGGRDYSDELSVYHALDALNAKRGISLIIHGAARGADTIAGQWAADRCVPCLSHPANWGLHGRVAGPHRNQSMLDEWKPDGVVAFPGGSGTADMIQRAEASGLKVWQPCRT